MGETGRGLLEQFMQIHGLLIRQFHQNHRERGPMGTPYSGQGRVLKILKLKPETTQKELAELLGVRPQSLGELLAKLEKNGYVTREPLETDRRVVAVRLTEKGMGAKEDEVPVDDNLFGCLSGEEQEQLGLLLCRIIDALEEHSASARRREICERHRGSHGPMHGGFGGPHHR